jgi:hypothetical protein
VEDGGGESGGDAKRVEACWKRVLEVDGVGRVESQVRADGRSIVRFVRSYRELWLWWSSRLTEDCDAPDAMARRN